jgi:membrane protein DedA with SNARE-associated domain
LGHACLVEAVQGLFGPLAIAVICSLLFVEELGVPLPMFPASGLLLVGGVMIAAGDISPWFFIPIAYVACVGGAMLGYTWSRLLGQERLERLAERLRLRRHLDTTADRLHRAGWLGVSIGRVLPGSRVYTSLIAGVTAMPLPTFMQGLFGADLVWIAVLVGLGVLVGIPAADYLHIAMAVFLRGVVVVIAVLASLAVLRLVRPPAVGSEGGERPRLVRLLAAIAPDAVIVAALAAGVAVALAKAGVVTDAFGVAIVASVVLLVYVLGTRLAFASTAGERLTGTSYRQVLPALE